MVKRRCFVIMPFSKTTEEHTEEYWTDHYNKFLKPLIEQSGELEAYRSKALREDILRGIITSLVKDYIVVADLTDDNANVYWELGVRQSFKNRTITIREEGTRNPFDLSTKSTLKYYPRDHTKNADFRRDFQEAMTDCLKHPERPDSHVLETISGRGTIYEIINLEVNIRRLEALVSELSRNRIILEMFIERTEPDSKTPSWRISCQALEYFITHRYIEEEDEIFDEAEYLLVEMSRLDYAFSHDPVLMPKEKRPRKLLESILQKVIKFDESISSILDEMKNRN